MESPLIHPVYSLISDGDQSREDLPFQVRDALSGEQVRQPFFAQGYALGDEILQTPPQPGHQGDPHAKIDTSHCKPTSVLQTFTRHAGSDLVQGARKKLKRACTDLEDDIIEEWNHFVPVSSRLHVTLAERLWHLLPPGYENRRDMFFYESPGAPYKRLSVCDGRPPRPYAGEERRTAAFLLLLPQLGQRKVRYLGTWAPSGTANLIWGCQLRHRHPELLMEPGFVFAELIGETIPERSFGLRWTLDFWRVEILIHEPVRSTGPQQQQRAIGPRHALGPSTQQRVDRR